MKKTERFEMRMTPEFKKNLIKAAKKKKMKMTEYIEYVLVNESTRWH